MTKPTFGLVVLRAADINLSLAFYRALGLEFVQEQHGTGPIHYSCDLGGVVLEIYPGKPGTAPDRRNAGATMIGFKVEGLESLLDRLGAGAVPIITPLQTSEWGKRAVIQDPDGRAVDLTEPNSI